jgi:glucan phosphoethanolaminetransferase (alkaline phosphatase superfamily)
MSRRDGLNVKIRALVVLLVLVAVSCAATFIWAVMKTDTIATTAENTGGSGAADQMLWLWILLCPPGAIASVALLGVILSRHRLAKPGATL